MARLPWRVVLLASFGQAGFPAPAFADDVQQVVIPLEALASDPISGAQIVGPGGDRIELHQPLRAARAIIANGMTLPLAIIGPVPRDAQGRATIPEDRSRIAWCTHDRGLKIMVGNTFACWQDRDGDGALETELRAIAATYSQPLTIALISTVGRAIPPRPYAVASPEQRNSYDLDYIPCGVIDGQRRYRRKLHNSPGVSPNGEGCRLVAVAEPAGNDGEARYQVEQMRFAINADGRPRLLSGIPPGELLDRFGDDEPIVALGTRRRFDEERAAAILPMAAPPFIFASLPKVKAAPADEPFLEGSVAYGYTGHLAKTITTTTMVATRSIAAGAAMYGVPMGDAGLYETPKIAWCAPSSTDHGGWQASCAVTTRDPAGRGEVTIIVDHASPAFAVQSLSYPVRATPANGFAKIDRGPVDFGVPIVIRYRVTRWGRRTARIGGEIVVGDWREGAFSGELPLDDDGGTTVRFGDGAVHIHRSADGGTIAEVTKPIAVGMTILPGETRR